jgi:hypothetical protein
VRVRTRDAAHSESPDEVRHYLVRSLTRSARGTWTLVGVSPLQLLNLRQAKAPKAVGWRLANAITGLDTTATLDTWTVSDSDPTAGTLRLGDELAAFARDGTTLALVRAQHGTAASGQDAGEAAQPALTFANSSVPDVLHTLLVDHAGINAAFIPLTDWRTETSSWLAQYRLNPLPIAEPAGVIELINELCQQIGLILWYDERTRTIRLQALRPMPSHRVVTLTDDDLVGEVAIATDLGKRVSQVELLFARRSALDSDDGPAAYRRRLLGESAGESAAEHGSPAPLAIRSRWFGANDDALAARTAATLVTQRRDGRTTYTLNVSHRHTHLDLGDVIRLVTRDLVDPAGNPLPLFAFVISRSPGRDAATIALVAERFPLVARYAYVLPNNARTYTATPLHEREPGWFLSASNGRLPNGDEGYGLG